MEAKAEGFFKENKIFIAIVIAGFLIGGSIYSAARLFRSEDAAKIALSEDPTAVRPSGTAGVKSSFSEASSSGQVGSIAAVQENDPVTAVAQGGSCISYVDAGNFVGESKCVFGKVEKVYASSGGTIFLDFCPDYKTCPFSAVIFKSDSVKFSDPEQYQGKTIEITGSVKTYQGRPEIILNDASQIKIK
jgi:hypothetical protein